MVRFVLPIAVALLLPSCSSSDVYCGYEKAGVQVACAEFVFSGDSQGEDVTSDEKSACTSGGGVVVDGCPTTNSLGTCTIVASNGSATVTGVEQVYAVGGVTAAEAQANCLAVNGMNGLTATWGAFCDTVADCPATCFGSSLTPAATACTAHACVAPAPQSCAPYACAGGACLTTCARDSDCAAAPCNVCPPDVELCLAPLGPVASLPAGACKKVRGACHPSPTPTCGAVGSFSAGARPSAMAFDGTNMWIVNSQGGDVTELSPTGATLGTFSVGANPSAIAFDGTNMWVTTGNGVVELSPTGATLGTFPVGQFPTAIAFDGTNMWVTDVHDGTVTELSPTGAKLGTFPVGIGYGLGAIAFDGTNMWVNTFGPGTGSVVELSPAGETLGTFPVGPYPYAIAFDGTNMWVVDNHAANVTELSPSGSTIGTFPVAYAPYDVAFDGTNMWVLGSEITKLSPAGMTLGTFPLGGDGNWAGGGIAFDGQHMWVADAIASGNNVIEL